MTIQEYLKPIIELSDRYYKQLMAWSETQQDVSLVPETMLEAYMMFTNGVFQFYNTEMEELEKQYVIAFDRIKFANEKPLSDKATDSKIKLTDWGQRMMVLERRLKSLVFAKQTFNSALRARLESKKDSIGL